MGWETKEQPQEDLNFAHGFITCHWASCGLSTRPGGGHGGREAKRLAKCSGTRLGDAGSSERGVVVEEGLRVSVSEEQLCRSEPFACHCKPKSLDISHLHCVLKN